MRILIVDALSHTRESLKTFLELQDEVETVVGVSSGFEALHLQKELKPDIVILDANLPDMDGLEVIRQLTATANLSVILLTLHIEDLDLQKAYDAGAQVCIERSEGAEPIVEAIRSQGKKTQNKDQN